MGYQLSLEDPVVESVRTVAIEQIDAAIDGTREDDPHEAIHEFRKRCKKLRALLRLVRPAFASGYRAENRYFRDAARRLAKLRDATALVETCDALRRRWEGEIDPGPIAAVRAALLERREGLAGPRELGARLHRAREAMARARERAGSWRLEDDGFAAVEGGFAKTYGRARRAMRVAYGSPSVEGFHEWRKRAKYHRHHVRLLREAWQPIEDPWRERLHELTDLLGSDHDLAVLADRIESTPDLASRSERVTLCALALRRSAELRALALPVGERLFAESRAGIVDRHWAYWRASAAEASVIRPTVGSRALATG